MSVRNRLALRFIDAAPPELRPAVLREFRTLVRDGLTKEAAHAFAMARAEVQGDLVAELQGVSSRLIRRFDAELAGLGWPKDYAAARLGLDSSRRRR
jgi:hypothetical protein